jgi:hypothetical protein
MNIRNAFGFLSFGLVMGFLPTLAPAWFSPTGIDGANARALWLEVMGMVQTAIGAARILGPVALRAFVRWLTFTPSPVAPVVPFVRDEARTEFMPAFDEASAREAA